MLDTLKASDFEPYIGTNVSIDIPGGNNVSIKLDEVTENKNAMMPRGETARIPFSLIFSGPLDNVFESGCYNVEQEKIGTIENVHISRIVPLSTDTAWYEIIFN